MTEFDVAAVDLSGILNTSAEDKAKQLPDPKTFRLLCVVPEAMEEFADSEIGIVKSNQSMYYEEVLTPVLFVVKLGPDAYTDTVRFPSGPSCKEGDFVIVRQVRRQGVEFRLGPGSACGRGGRRVAPAGDSLSQCGAGDGASI